MKNRRGVWLGTVIAGLVFGIIGVGCDDDHEDESIRAQKAANDEKEEKDRIGADTKALTDKADKLTGDISQWEQKLANLNQQKQDQIASFNATYQRGTGLVSNLDWMKGGNMAQDAADSCRTIQSNLNDTDYQIGVCQGKLDTLRGDLGKTKQWQADLAASEAAKASAKSASDAARTVGTPPIVMPHVPMPAGCPGPRR